MTAGRPVGLGPQTGLVVHPLTDWHVGAGHGIPGGADAVVVRDRDGLPYLPGTTLTGLLRDAARTVARALDGGAPDGVWQRWHRVAFGDAGSEGPPLSGRRLTPAAVAIGPARLPARVRAELAGRPELVEATVTLRPGVAIDPKTGRAADDMLRFVELARGGMALRSTVQCAPGLDGDGLAAVTALVVLAAAWCDRLGGDRRRGPGEAVLELDGQQAPAWAQWLAASGWTPPDPAPTAPAPSESVTLGTVTPGTDWVALDLEITTVDPVRAQARTAGNVVGGHDHLPGSLLLAWLSDRWGAELVHAAVAADAVVVRHAHPQVGAERGLPIPFTVFRAKGAAPTVSVGTPAEGERQVRDRWVAPAPVDGTVVLQTRATAHAAHNQVDRALQRPTGSTGIYQVEVIPAGRRLRGRVLLTGAVVEALRAAHGDSWPGLLSGPARFGARRRGEYGGCTVEVAALEPVAVPPLPAAGPVMLWAITDLLVRGPGLRPSADPADLTRALRRLLGAPVTVTRVTARTRRRDGWQGRWQLPRESLVGIAAGSVLELSVPDGAQVDAAGWAQLVVCGLGERRAEGFGEVLVDPGLLAMGGPLPVAEGPPPKHTPPPPDGAPDDAERATLDLLARAVRREEILAAVAETRDGDEYAARRSAFAGLSRSQRGSWRAVTAAAAAAGRLDRVIAHADGWQQKKDAKRTAQREVAARVRGLIVRTRPPDRAESVYPIEDVLDIAPATEAERALALAALVADVIDALAREGSDQ